MAIGQAVQCNLPTFYLQKLKIYTLLMIVLQCLFGNLADWNNKTFKEEKKIVIYICMKKSAILAASSMLLLLYPIVLIHVISYHINFFALNDA